MSILPENLADPAEYPATCRGCGRPIRRLGTPAELWEDEAGVTVCVKARLEDIGAGQRPGYVQHQPLPAGLVGAPL
jgi:hypothetical protein